MRILVTGANGMLGHDVVRVAEDMRHQVVALSHDDLDVTDPARVERVITREPHPAVINCTAWTNVDGAEESERGGLHPRPRRRGLRSGRLPDQCPGRWVRRGRREESGREVSRSIEPLRLRR